MAYASKSTFSIFAGAVMMVYKKSVNKKFNSQEVLTFCKKLCGNGDRDNYFLSEQI